MKCGSPYQFRRRSGAWIEAPCGKCAACRVNRSTEWATRIMHELEDEPGKIKTGFFLTLTYEKEPEQLEKNELQKFFKRVRKAGIEMRYFACGEYGEKNGRAHFHVAAITSNAPIVQWNKYWTLGFVDVGTLTFQSARYTANYLLKQAHKETTKQPPFQLMSQGLGKAWALANRKTIKKGLTRNGNMQRTPRFYRTLLDITVPRPNDPMDMEHFVFYQQRDRNNNALTERKIRRDSI